MGIKRYLLILFFTAVFLYTWAASVVLQTFIIHPDILGFPESEIKTVLFLFIGYLLSVLAGLIISILFNKKTYIRLFSFLLFLLLFSFIGGKSYFG